MKNLKLIRDNVNYKGHQMVVVEDALGQRVTIILGINLMFASIADAKRWMNTCGTIYVIDDCRAEEYAKAAKELFEEAMMRSLRP